LVFSELSLQWQDLLRNVMAEVEWRETGYVSTPEEYMENAVVSFALGPVVLPQHCTSLGQRSRML
jgi:hypothetical protein